MLPTWLKLLHLHSWLVCKYNREKESIRYHLPHRFKAKSIKSSRITIKQTELIFNVHACIDSNRNMTRENMDDPKQAMNLNQSDTREHTSIYEFSSLKCPQNKDNIQLFRGVFHGFGWLSSEQRITAMAVQKQTSPHKSNQVQLYITHSIIRWNSNNGILRLRRFGAQRRRKQTK
jgi:hypothetical protein